MSFTIKDFNYFIPKADFDKYHESDLYLSLNSLININQDIFLDKAVRKWIKEECLGFQINTDSDNLNIKFKLVTTTANIVGFCGYYLDLESGYILLGKLKRDEYIPYFNLYRLLEFMGVTIIPELITTLVERFKVHDLSLEGFITGLNQSNKYKSNLEKSVISNFLNRQIDKKGELNIKFYTSFFRLISNLFDDIDFTHFNNISGAFKVCVDNNYPEFKEFLYMISETIDMNRPIWNTLEVGVNYNNNWTEIFRKLSSMYHINTDSKSNTKHMDNDDSILLNIYDIAEQQGRDIALDFVLDLSSSDVKNSVLQKIGVDSYLKGNLLSKIRASLSSSSSKRVLKRFKDNRYKMTTIDSISSESSQIPFSTDFDSNVREIEKVLDKLDSKIMI